MRSIRRSKAYPVALLLALLVTTGCAGADDGSADGPDPTPVASASSTSSPTDSPGSATPSDSPATAPAVVPATGPELAMDVATVRLPDGWELTENQASFLATGWNRKRGSSNFMGLSQFPSLVSDLSPAELEEVAQEDGSFGDRGGVVKAPVVVDGVEMRRVTGGDGVSEAVLFIALVEGDLVTLKLEQNRDIPRPERRRVVESVLASFAWR